MPMSERTEHRDGWYESFSQDIPDDAEYIHVAYGWVEGRTTAEFGTLNALGEGLSEQVQECFDNGNICITDDSLTLTSFYAPGPGWEPR